MTGTDPSGMTSEPEPIPAPEPRRRWRFQVGLRTVVLITAAVAVWLTYALDRRRSAELAARIASLSPLARELIVDDPAKAAVVKRQELWYDDNRWDVYLPAGRRYRLCVATRKVADTGLPPAAATAPLDPGRHVLSLDQAEEGGVWKVTAVCDETPALSVTEPKEWDPGSGSAGGGEFTVSEQVDPGKPVVLFRRRFMTPRVNGSSTTPPGPTQGVLLWIEPDAPAPQKTRPATPGSPTG